MLDLFSFPILGILFVSNIIPLLVCNARQMFVSYTIPLLVSNTIPLFVSYTRPLLISNIRPLLVSNTIHLLVSITRPLLVFNTIHLLVSYTRTLLISYSRPTFQSKPIAIQHRQRIVYISASTMTMTARHLPQFINLPLVTYYKLVYSDRIST